MKNISRKACNDESSLPWRHIALGATFLLAGVVLDALCSRKGHKHNESMLDGALDDTFPASDPTATQDFSAPEDRAALNS